MQKITNWLVLVIHQEERTREEAVRVCDGLVRRFWASANFDIRWVSFDDLEREMSWPEATQLALEARLIIVSLALEGGLPGGVKRWMESWIDQRAGREGAAIIGVGEKPYLSGPAAAKFRFLRHLAHRAGMDYLTEIPQQIGPAYPEDTEFYTARAEAMTKVMGQILSKPLVRHEPPERG